jgi:H+/Cl- antiporter ClcA
VCSIVSPRSKRRLLAALALTVGLLVAALTSFAFYAASALQADSINRGDCGQACAFALPDEALFWLGLFLLLLAAITGTSTLRARSGPAWLRQLPPEPSPPWGK